MVDERELLTILDELVEVQRADYEKHVRQEKWRTALNSLLTATIWRSIALAIRAKLIPDFDPSAEPLHLAHGLREICRPQLESASERTEVEKPAEVLFEVLNAVIALAAVLRSSELRSSGGGALLALAAGDLGRCDVMLGFAEQGFWTEIAGWKRSRGGRRVGYRAAWKTELQTEIQTIMSSMAGRSQDEIALAIIEGTPWNKARPSEVPTMVKALRSMVKEGTVQWPRKGN